MADISLGLDLNWDIDHGKFCAFVSVEQSEEELVSVTLDWETIGPHLEDDLSEFLGSSGESSMDEWQDLSQGLRQLADHIDEFLRNGVKEIYEDE